MGVPERLSDRMNCGCGWGHVGIHVIECVGGKGRRRACVRGLLEIWGGKGGGGEMRLGLEVIGIIRSEMDSSKGELEEVVVVVVVYSL